MDPLDGTSNYANGLPIFAISVALKQGTQTLLGVVHLFSEKLTGRLEEVVPISTDLKSTSARKKCYENRFSPLVFRIIWNIRPNDNTRYFTEISKKIRGIRRFGAAAYDLSLVAAGFLDGFWELGLNEWDYLAANLIIEEAGGKVYFHQHSDFETLVAGPASIVSQIRREHEKVDANV